MKSAELNSKIEKIMRLMSRIRYGYVDINNKKHEEADEEYASLYKLQSPEELSKSKLGTCWDQVELERYYFKTEGINCKTYFIVYYGRHKSPTHTFLVYRNGKKYSWFEHSWERCQGVHEYDSLKELLTDVKNTFIKIELPKKINSDNLRLSGYNKPDYGISCGEFIRHCESGKIITI